MLLGSIFLCTCSLKASALFEVRAFLNSGKIKCKTVCGLLPKNAQLQNCLIYLLFFYLIASGKPVSDEKLEQMLEEDNTQIFAQSVRCYDKKIIFIYLFVYLFVYR